MHKKVTELLDNKIFENLIKSVKIDYNFVIAGNSRTLLKYSESKFITWFGENSLPKFKTSYIPLWKTEDSKIGIRGSSAPDLFP